MADLHARDDRGNGKLIIQGQGLGRCQNKPVVHGLHNQNQLGQAAAAQGMTDIGFQGKIGGMSA